MPASTFHLDTNYLVYYTSGGDAGLIERVETWLRAGCVIQVSAMAWAEFQCGPLSKREHELAHAAIHGVVPITLQIANAAGFLFQATGRRSRSLPDCIIAATAINQKVPLATNNRDDFTPFLAHGLEMV